MVAVVLSNVVLGVVGAKLSSGPAGVQVVDANLIVNRPAGKSAGAVGNRVAECTVGDETGVIVLIVKNEQGMLCFSRHAPHPHAFLFSSVSHPGVLQRWHYHLVLAS